MKKVTDIGSVLIRHDYKRAMYRAMLSVLPPEEVIEYFNLEPLILDGEPVQGKKLFDLLWSEKAKIPCNYDYCLDNRLERFLISKGHSTASILEKVLWLNNNSTHIPGKVLLTWFYPKLESVFNSVDTRDIVFTMISIFTENWLPYHINRRIKWWEEGEWTHSVLIYHSDPFYPALDDWDMELIAGPQVLNSPLMVALPPFEDFRVISEYREAGKVIWATEDRPVQEEGRWLIRGEVYGKVRPFLDFCAEKGIDLSAYEVKDRMVVECVKDYFCPIRNRVAMHAGGAYGAPVCLYSVKHKRLKKTGRAVLGKFIEDMAREEGLQDAELERKHQALINLLSQDPRFEYHAADESLTLNGRYFTKGIPAKILKHLFEAHTHQGKCDFEYRDLKRIFEITQGQKNSNFEVRFYRMVEKLKEECPSVRIEKTGRGLFRLEVMGGLQYREIAVSPELTGSAPAP